MMSSAEAASLIAVLHGAYPGTYFDGAVGDVFANSLITNDYESSRRAVNEWVTSMDRFPTIAELNRVVRRIKEHTEEQTRALPAPERTLDRAGAAAAFRHGYHQARVRAGDAEHEIEAKVGTYLRRYGIEE